MCGIFGYIGKGEKTGQLIDGLARLEYRGYDSCGIAIVQQKNHSKKHEISVNKQSGKISRLRENLKSILRTRSQLAILHTRWATHGRPTQINAHPHLSAQREFAVVHNGIIENYLQLKEYLRKEGYTFKSDTDTEVVVHLIDKFYKGSLIEAVYKAARKLQGSFALGIVSSREPDKLIGVRKGSPLIVGLGKSGSFIASDIPALLPFTKKVIYLKDSQVALLQKDTVKIFNFKGDFLSVRAEQVGIKTADAEKKGYPHFMLKEIFEQPDVLKKTFAVYLDKDRINFPGLNLKASYLKKVHNIFITACGTAYHAGYVAKYFLEKYCAVDVEIDTSSEFRYRKLNLKKGDLLIAISQSGETADTLAAVKEAKKTGARVLSICNVLGSSLVKESHGLIYTLAGPEIGVASTKAYTAQVTALYLFALYLGQLKGSLSKSQVKIFLQELKKIPHYQKEILQNITAIKKIAKKFSKLGCFLFLGRGINYPSALEGALKLKEISYIPAEGYPAGEMKHGPIALIDEYRAVVCIAPKDDLYEKMVSNMQETKARKGRILGILNYGDKEASLLADEIIYIPQLKNQELSPLLVAVCQQLLAYFVARNLGCEIDQPRNLAKSVTVE
jgi:glucosamine--fructose-6-phosphate aminotransferase (isomerizing)